MTRKSLLLRIEAIRKKVIDYFRTAKRVWEWEYLEFVGTVLVFVFSMLSIVSTITADKISDNLHRIRQSIVTMRSYGDRFVAKHDLIRVGGPLVYMQILADEPDLSRQAYIYSRQATGFTGDIEDLNREAERKISGVYDYQDIVDIDKVLKEHENILNTREETSSFLEGMRTMLFSAITIFQITITFIAFILGIRLIRQRIKKIKLKTTIDVNQARSAM